MSIADRIRVKFALARGKRAVSGACPSSEDILAWHEKLLDNEGAREIQHHVAHCDRCFALWSGLVALQPEPRPDAVAASDQGWFRRRSWLALPAMALGAVAVSLWVGLWGGAPIPNYGIDIQGAMDVRGGADTAGVLTLRDGTRLEIVLIPETADDGPIAVVVYALANDQLTRVSVPAQVTAKGVASIEGVLGSDIVLPPQTTRLLVAVGRKGELPERQALRVALEDVTAARADDWQGWAVPVQDVR